MGVCLDGKGGGKELRGEKGESVIGIYYIRQKPIFTKKKKGIKFSFNLVTYLLHTKECYCLCIKRKTSLQYI